MRKILVVVAIVGVVGCRQPSPRSPASSEDNDDETAIAAPPPTPAATPPTSSCELLTPVARLDPLFGNLPPALSEDDIYNALVQFLVASGTSIDKQDRSTHTIVTRFFAGTPIRSRCGAEHDVLVERTMYALNIVVIGSRVVIHQECREAPELETHPQSPTQLAWRECRVSSAATSDAAIPLNVFEGAVGLIDMKRSPPGQATPPRWWCVGEVTCWRDRQQCAGMAQADKLGCHPMTRVYCRGEMCFATLSMCALGGNGGACVYQD